MKIAKVIKLTSKLKYCNKKKEKAGQQEVLVRTVPLKAGQLESML